ncbi:MAG TPA: 30S ribosomal protein S7 [Rhodothermales bacterium]|nr:30S ribosomal protein S7 [Bacteroidetes Order II. bacterium]HCR48319.1 30S ribosomal protein S7 [Bacteroidota bacterium]HRK73119.1 30S ribosomal protein S7 [Rhodothermales bacterium]HRR09057.1 30S ribosomal protein S7 [Rhodothermales bacterium]
MRKKRAEKRQVLPDPIYGDVTVSKFINAVMQSGKKSIAQAIVYKAFEIIEERTKEPGVEVFRKALNNVAPVVEVRSRRVGGATYQVPMEVRPERRSSLAYRWLINYASARSDKSMAIRLANELISAAKGEGAAVKKKDDTHRMAEANKAFAHFRF